MFVKKAQGFFYVFEKKHRVFLCLRKKAQGFFMFFKNSKKGFDAYQKNHIFNSLYFRFDILYSSLSTPFFIVE
ncbi:hypothetical protein DMO16_07765 [Fictibacillus sp. S7]|nr:hypothetical protein DMO16_07765 [Fictibacillus sp. S7]